MRSPFHNDNFEDYLQDKVQQHRMYPSDQLWRSIHEQLHENKQWPALTFISIIILAMLVVGTLLLKPADKLLNNTRYRLTTKEVQLAIAEPVPNSVEPLEESMATATITRRTIADATQKISEQNTLALAIVNTAPAGVAPVPAQLLPPASVDLMPVGAALQASRADSDYLNTDSSLAALPRIDTLPAAAIIFHNGAPQPSYINGQFNFAADAPMHNSNDELLKNLGFAKKAPAITLKPVTPKFELQAYYTPSASYRRLLNGKSGKGGPTASYPIPIADNSAVDVNKVVRNSPAVGMEFGLSMGYHLNRQLTLKTGVQFNIRQYDIEAYTYNTSNDPGTIPPGTGNAGDPKPAPNYQDNFSTPATLRNRYREISMPVGVDWKANPSRRLTWGITALVAPTYMFNKDPFVLSANFKNYTDGSSLLRHWNVNTSFESYLSYRTGDFRWQIGPQFRYQQLSSFKTDYPIKEYLLDYGIKFSVTKTIR